MPIASKFIRSEKFMVLLVPHILRPNVSDAITL
jgi:hypothetical protein